MMNKQSLWFQGLLYAESLSKDDLAHVVKHLEHVYTFNDYDNGVLDYYEHINKLKERTE